MGKCAAIFHFYGSRFKCIERTVFYVLKIECMSVFVALNSMTFWFIQPSTKFTLAPASWKRASRLSSPIWWNCNKEWPEFEIQCLNLSRFGIVSALNPYSRIELSKNKTKKTQKKIEERKIFIFIYIDDILQQNRLEISIVAAQ